MPCAGRPRRKATPFIETVHPFIHDAVILRMTIILSLWMALPAVLNATGVDVPSYTLKLVKNLVEPKPVREFDCREKVYLMTTWFKVHGPHRVTARWFNPEGMLQDEGHLDFVAQHDQTDGWLALEFLNVENPAGSTHLNAEVAKFYGQWKVRVLLDNNFLEEREFFVRCK